MKLTRATYPMILAMLIMFNIRLMIKEFSEELEKELTPPILIIFIILLVIGFILAVIDKELFHVVTDERTKKVDRSAGYYSWWFTILFVFIFGFIGFVLKFTMLQYVNVIITEMFLTMLIFHMYFNFKGKT